jgi:hypothetical protein
MSLQQTQVETEETARFDAATLKKVVQLAERLQAREDETVSQADLETIGAEVGLRPESIRAAVRELQTQQAQQSKPKPHRRRNATDRAIVAAFWSAGWVLPFLGMGGAYGMHLGPLAAGIAFLSGIAAYVGGGIVLTGVMGTPEGSSNDPLQAAAHFQRAALINQFAQLQAAGVGSPTHSAFLSIEVVGAAEIGRAAQARGEVDPFRAFRSWVDWVVSEQGGQLHSGPDNELVGVFPEDAAAVRAARKLQDGIARFNTESNQLGYPLALRCGLRAGPSSPGGASDFSRRSLATAARELQRCAVPGDVVVGPELAAAALTELGPMAPLPQPIAGERAFSWLAARR